MTGSWTNTRNLGSTGLEVTSVCVGGSPLGSMPHLYGYEVSAERAVAAVEAVFDGPFNFLDTSNAYSDGDSERRIGEVIRRRGGLPPGFVLATKVDSDPRTGDYSGARVRRSAEESLERLGLDHFELLHLHDPEVMPFDVAAAPGGPVEALVELRDRGLASYIGVAGGNLAEMNGGKGDAYATLPGFLPPSAGNGGWPQAVDNYQRLNYNVVRIHQEPGSPYMLDVADEMGLMVIDEVAIRGSQSGQDWIAGHDNMVNHARALVLRDRNHPAIIRWSQNNEPNQSGQDSEQFEKDLYAAMNGADGTRPIIAEVGVGGNVSLYPGMTYANFAVIPHYVDGFGRYGEGLITVNGRPDGEGEYIWPACNNKQGFEWFATATLAKRGKNATDLRPYTLLSAWASVVPGVRSTDFTPEEGGHPIYGADNLPDPWSNPQIQRVQAAFNPVAAVDLPYWSASGASDSNGTFPLPRPCPPTPATLR